MRWLLTLLIAVIVISDIMSWPLSLAPGLSVKNAVLYMLLFALFFRAALRGLGALELPALHAIFAVWVCYAIASWVVAAGVIKYANYGLIENGITLKAELLDSVIFFLVAFHGLRTLKDVETIFKALVVAVGVASLCTLLSVAGVLHLAIKVGTSGAEEGRVFGVFGHANDTAALMDCLIPVSVAVAMRSRGWQRLMWFGGALASLAVLLATVSRGGYVAAVIGSAGAVWLLRRQLPLQRVVMWSFVGAAATLLAVVVAGLAMPHIGEVIQSRLLVGGGGTGVDSGRAGVWMELINRMMEQPITMLTGYGWDVYWVMPFRFATHNWYLNLWFNLGIVGLGAFLSAMFIALVKAKSAAEAASADMQVYLQAFIFGMVMLLVAICFTNLSGQWALVWIYYGAALRGAQIVLEEPASVPSPVGTPAPSWRRAHSGAFAPVVAGSRRGAL